MNERERERERERDRERERPEVPCPQRPVLQYLQSSWSCWVRGAANSPPQPSEQGHIWVPSDKNISLLCFAHNDFVKVHPCCHSVSSRSDSSTTFFIDICICSTTRRDSSSPFFINICICSSTSRDSSSPFFINICIFSSTSRDSGSSSRASRTCQSGIPGTSRSDSISSSKEGWGHNSAKHNDYIN